MGGAVCEKVDPPGPTASKCLGGRCSSLHMATRRVRHESYRGGSGYRKAGVFSCTGWSTATGEIVALQLRRERFWSILNGSNRSSCLIGTEAMRRLTALGASATEARPRCEVAVGAAGEAVCRWQQERCGRCARDLDGDATAGDQSGGGQERRAASDIGAASVMPGWPASCTNAIFCSAV